VPDKQLSTDQRIAFHDSGTGPALLFLHSFGHNRNMWYPQLQHFFELGYRVIAPDMPGHGDSPFRAEGHGVDEFGAIYVDLLEELGVDKAVVIGISIGGYVALRMWARNPGLFAGLVMCCSKAEADSEEIRGRRRAQVENIHANGLESFVLMTAPKRVSPVTAKARPWVVDWIKMMNLTVSAEANAATLEAMARREDDSETLATIDVPTLILSGSDDIFIPPDSPKRLHAGIKGSIHHVVKEAGHVASLECPAVVNGHIEAFLRDAGINGRG
jgi:pimeloyl-ACP methyl ester carboxylesterase